MRTRAPLAALTLAIVAAACNDDARSPLPTQPTVAASISVTADCDETLVRDLIRQLYPEPPAKQVRESLLNKFDQGLAFMPDKQTQAWKKFVDIMRKIDDDFDAGRLPVYPPSPTTAERRAQLYAELFVCAGYEAPDFPTGTDAIIGVIDDPTIQRTFISPLSDYAIQTPPNMFSQPVVILGDKQSDSFIVQTIYAEWPIKTEITASPPGMEVPGKQSIIKICQYESDFDNEADRSFVRIVRRQTVGEGSIVTVLRFTSGGPFLPCPAEPPDVIGSASFFERSLAAARGALRGASAYAASVFTLRELHAASMVDGGVGGFVDDFASFYAGATVPDLRIQSIAVDPAAPTTANSLSFDFVVENIGFGDAQSSNLHYTVASTAAPTVILQEDDIFVEGVAAATRDGETVTPGETEVGSNCDCTFTLPVGTYIVTVTADSENDLGELNETATTPFANNTATFMFTVTSGPIIELQRAAGLAGTAAMRTSRLSPRKTPGSIGPQIR